MSENLKVNAFIVASIMLFGTLVGGTVSYIILDDRLTEIEQEVQQPTQTVYLNTTQQDQSLINLFQEKDQSVVSLTARGSQQAQGSGFIYDERGHIVTNHHVVDRADTIEVTFTDGTTQNAELIGTDIHTDLAILKVERQDLEPLELGNSEHTQVGERVAAIGNPFGLRGSMTAGIISQKGRLLPTQGGFSIPGVIQTDAAINPGNSGGPLMNLEGQVIGVNTAIETRTGGFSGIGFAIPSNTVQNIASNIIEEQEHKTPWLGITGRDVNPEIAEKMNLENVTGFLIIDIQEEGPADLADINPSTEETTIGGIPSRIGGDVITHIDGERMRGIEDILFYLQREAEVGQEITVTVIRNGQEQNISIILQERPETVQQ